jgi:RimJ/RimL family protein N-acetyltransferase
MDTLATGNPGLVLRPLSVTDAPQLHRLIAANRSHLTAHGDYADLVDLSLSALRVAIADAVAKNHPFAIVLDGGIIGRMDLIPVDPPRYGLGYWLVQSATGRGHATAALAGLSDYAKAQLASTDLYAGVTHGNDKSIAVLARAGFAELDIFERYIRFHRTL